MKPLTQKQIVQTLSMQRDVRPAQYNRVECSQCGRQFGAGNFGYSHCRDHKGK